MNRLFPPFIGGRGAVGLLVLRLVAGSAFILHGMGKIGDPFHWMDKMGMGVPGFLHALAPLAEFGGAIAWIARLPTPPASPGLRVDMLVAFLMVHLPHGDPFVAVGGRSFEPALDYLAVALVLLLVGPGTLSLDAALFGRGAVPRAGRGDDT